MTEIPHVISLGAGVQSSTMAIMAARGELGPMPKAAIFADTQDESPEVYKWIKWLKTQLPFPVYESTAGKLSDAAKRVRLSRRGTYYMKPGLPAFIRNANGTRGKLQRQCTRDYKIRVIERQIRLHFPQQNVVQWMGISTDEADRQKPSQTPYIENLWPLIDRGMSRADCILWMTGRGYPRPPRSSCVYCPHHSDAEWVRLRDEEPDQFQIAVEFERDYQRSFASIPTFAGVPFFHRSLVPLDRVEFRDADGTFSDECSGVCRT